MLYIHRGERAETLADALGAVLARPLADPFAAEVVAVPAKGVERWLTQRLAGMLGAADGDGVSANIAFPSPAALVAEALAGATGIAADDDPWAPDRMVWSLLRVIDAAVGEPWCAVLAHHLGADEPAGRSHRAGRRFATAARIAALFDGYAAHRPTVLTAWATGSDTDGCGTPLPEDLRWQPELWRRLRADLGTPSPAERLTDACARLRSTPAIVALPQRLSLFGVTRLSTDQLLVLDALGQQRDVHLWLIHPSPVLWKRLGEMSSPTSVIPSCTWPESTGMQRVTMDPGQKRAGMTGERAGMTGERAGVTGVPAEVAGECAGVTGERVGVAGVPAGMAGERAGTIGWHQSTDLGTDRVAEVVAPVRAGDGSALVVSHPLSAALGRDVRELQQRLRVLGGGVRCASSGRGDVLGGFAFRGAGRDRRGCVAAAGRCGR
nr:exodeoxyribonuclease V subunit gamma [Nocardia terpenica]